MNISDQNWQVSNHSDNDEIVVRNGDDEIICNVECDNYGFLSKQTLRDRAQAIALLPEAIDLLRILWAETEDCRIIDLLNRLP